MEKIIKFEPANSVVKTEDNVTVVVMSSATDPENVLEVRMTSDVARHLVAQLERALNAYVHYGLPWLIV